MKRVVVLIDGYNVYHALDEWKELRKYKWLDYSKLIFSMVSKKDKIVGIHYFTSLMTWKPEKVAKHKIFIKANELHGVNVVYGKYKDKDRFCPYCRKEYKSHEEKQPDVNIAIHLFKLAMGDHFDAALIMSADSDLVPALKDFRTTFPNKEVGVLFPFGRGSKELRERVDFHRRVKRGHLDQSMFPEEIPLGDGQKLTRPASWR